MLKTIVIAGTLDTKGEEFAFVEKLIRARGLSTCVIDFGVIGEPRFKPDIDNDEVARAGGSSIDKLRNEKDKADAMRVMKEGLIVIVRTLYEQGNLQGIISMGGSGGTSIATAAMRTLPLGIPKLIVSTVGGGDVAPYVGSRDISIMPSVVDIAGINRISRLIYANAAGAIAGMVETEMPPFEQERPMIAASMFGNTTACVERARTRLEGKGFEVLVFHATGTGGRTMQSLVEDDFIA
ncbi:MAG: Tm-1-like ATP-binding domain-containing protein, partial [Pyrinomonadaceae bacterium]|nr:Tm-1-like ATP-binding domain-containing protein [Pyrinomonadaceae bacterium]